MVSPGLICFLALLFLVPRLQAALPPGLLHSGADGSELDLYKQIEGL